MTFTTTKLVGNRVLVKGQDVFGTEGQTIVDSTQWDEINATTAYDQATEAFDAAVEEFFKPLTEAAEKMHTTVAKPADPATYVVLKEEVAPTLGQKGSLVKLTHDSIVLRLIEQGDGSRLVWVGDTLEVLDGQAVLPSVTVPSTDGVFA